MSSGQSPIVLREGNSLQEPGVTTNIATAQAEKSLAAAQWSADGKDIYPQSVAAKRISSAEGFYIDDSTWLANGIITAEKLIQTESVITNAVQVGSNIISEDHIALSPTTTLTALGTANLGTVTAGTIGVSSGQVSIGSADAGVSISNNIIRCVKGGAPTIVIDGDTGIVTCTSFQFTADGSSAVNLATGSHVFADAITVGATTLGTIRTNAASGAAKATTFAQASVPTALNAGDMWVDTDDGNKLYRAAAAGANEVKAGEWVAVQDSAYTSKNITFAQDAAPTALTAGDMWVDTNDSNKLYRASAAGSGSWVLYRDAGAAAGANAVQPDGTGGVTVDANKYITTIDCANGLTIKSNTTDPYVQITSSGLTIQSAASGNRIVITHSSLVVYKTGTTAAVSITAAAGISIRNNTSNTTPAQYERLSFLNSSGVEQLMVYSHYDATVCGLYSTNSDITISTSGSGKHVTLSAEIITLTGGDVGISTGNDFTVYNGIARANHFTCTDGAGTDRATLWSGSSAPSGGSSGDIYMRTGTTDPGLYVNESGTWYHATTH